MEALSTHLPKPINGFTLLFPFFDSLKLSLSKNQSSNSSEILIFFFQIPTNFKSPIPSSLGYDSLNRCPIFSSLFLGLLLLFFFIEENEQSSKRLDFYVRKWKFQSLKWVILNFPIILAFFFWVYFEPKIGFLVNHN